MSPWPARAADEQIAASFPGGDPARGHLLFRVEDEGTTIGSLWIGPADYEQPDRWWVWHITIDVGYRGRGCGKTVMLLAERDFFLCRVRKDPVHYGASVILRGGQELEGAP